MELAKRVRSVVGVVWVRLGQTDQYLPTLVDTELHLAHA